MRKILSVAVLRGDDRKTRTGYRPDMLRMIAFTAALTGCITSIPVTYQEQCAARGMMLTGVTSSNERAGIYAGRGGYAVASSYGESVSCRLPESKEDRCMLQAWQASLAVKTRFHTGARNFALFLGWSAFLLPGLVMYEVFNGQKNDAGNQAIAAGKAAIEQCVEDQ